MEVKAANETEDVAEAAAFVQAFADLLGVDKNAFGVSFPKDVVEYEYPFDLNSTIDAIVAVIKKK
jgi:predicted TIM-barrel fold metal-dependent hydrolase